MLLNVISISSLHYYTKHWLKINSYYRINIKTNNVNEVDVKTSTYLFLDDMVNIKNVDPNKIKLDKEPFRHSLVYYIGYVTTNNVKPLYLIIKNINGYFE